MAVGYRTTAAVTTSTTASLATTMVTTPVAGELLALHVMTRGTTPPTVTTPAGWFAPANNSHTGGAGTEGIDSGNVRTTVLFKVAVGSDTAPALTLSGTPTLAMAYISAYTLAAGETWGVECSGGGDTAASTTSLSVTGNVLSSIKGGDWIAIFAGLNNDAGTFTSRSISATGLTVGAATGRISKAGSTVGNNGAVDISNAAVSAGTATAAPVFGMVLSAAATNNAGAATFYRLRAGGGSAYAARQENSGSTGASTAASVSPSLPAGTLGGHGRYLLAAIAADGQTITTPTGWTLDTTGAVSTLNYYQFRKPVIDGETSWTFTPSAACSMAWWVREVAGLTEPTPKDASQSASGAAGGTTQSTGTTATTAQANELALGLFAWTVAAGTSATVTGYTNSFAEDADNQTSKGAGSNVGLAVADKALTATGTVESTATWSATVAARIGVAVTYRTGGVSGLVVSADATGHAAQGHLFYATGSARWWLLYARTDSPTILRAASSTDLVTWTDADATLTLAGTVSYDGFLGLNLAASYEQISGTDVVHVGYTHKVAASDHRTRHVRATISGATLTWGADAQTATSTGSVNMKGGDAVLVDSAGRVTKAHSYSGGGQGDMYAFRSTNLDSGGAWTAGFGALATLAVSASQGSMHNLADLGSGNVLYVYPNGSGASLSNNILWSKWNGTNWTGGGTPPDAASLYGSPWTGTIDDRDVTIAARTTTDTHLIVRRPEAGNALNHWRYNGTSWTQQADLPAQVTKATAGLVLATDGTDVWAFVISSAAGEAVRACKWSSGAGTWGAWADAEASSQTRTALTGARDAAAGTIGLAWTEVDGASFRIVTEPFAAVVPPTPKTLADSGAGSDRLLVDWGGPVLAGVFSDSESANQVALVTSLIGPANGDILVVKAQSQFGDGNPFPTPTGGGQTYTLVDSDNSVSHDRVAMWTVTVAGSPAPFAVGLASPGATNNSHSFVVEWWTQATLDATPAKREALYASAGLPSTTLTVESAPSAVSVLISDWNSVDGTSRAYTGTGVVEELYIRDGGNYAGYYLYQRAATVASQTIGMSAPAAQAWSIEAVEVQRAAGAVADRKGRIITSRQAVHRASRW